MLSLACTNFILYSIQLAYILNLLRLNWAKHLLIIVGLQALFVTLFLVMRGIV
jgi:hypothetical protein